MENLTKSTSNESPYYGELSEFEKASIQDCYGWDSILSGVNDIDANGERRLHWVYLNNGTWLVVTYGHIREWRAILAECVKDYEDKKKAQPTGHLWPDPNHVYHARETLAHEVK